MRVEQEPGGPLLISADPVWLRALLVGLGAAVLAAVWLQEPREPARVLLGGLGSLLPLGGAALLERVRFELDVAQRRLRWRRASLLRRRSGELAFSEISDVAVRVRHERDSDRPLAREVPWYYVVLVTAAGELRLSDRTYRDEAGQRRIADAIRRALGLPALAAPPLAESVEQLAAAGEVIEAIKLARRQRGLGLAEAKALVDRLRG
jgi:hypothetical protein